MVSRRLAGWVPCVLVLLLLSACGTPSDGTTPMPNPMPPEWQPQPLGRQALRFKDSLSIVMYHGDLWATTWAHDVLGPGFLLRFNRKTGAIREYVVGLDAGAGIPSLLLATERGELWGAGMNPLAPYDTYERNPCHSGTMPWALSRYDPGTDRFVAIRDKDGLLRGCEIFSFTEGRDGNLWLLLADGVNSPFFHVDPDATVEERDEAFRVGRRPRIVRFDPVSQKATLLGLDSQMNTLALESISDVLVGPDGAMWLIAERETDHLDEVYRFDLSTGKLAGWGGASPSARHGALPRLYFDHSGRLWTSFVSWTDILPDQVGPWKQPDSTVFITQLKETPEETFYTRVLQIYQSADGLMWFASGAGLMTYDLAKDQWARATPSYSTIVQDEDGDIWTAAYGQFYRYRPTH